MKHYEVKRFSTTAIAIIAIVLAACGSDDNPPTISTSPLDTAATNDSTVGFGDGAGNQPDSSAATDTGTSTADDTATNSTDDTTTPNDTSTTAPDDASATDGGGATGTCKGRCNKFTQNATCQCDSGCKDFDDCCPDFEKLCSTPADDCDADADCD